MPDIVGQLGGVPVIFTDNGDNTYSPKVTTSGNTDMIGQLGGVPVAFTKDPNSNAYLLKVSDSSSGTGNKFQYAIIADRRPSGTEGGTFTSGAWRTRDLNIKITDPDEIVSISANQFILQAGTYIIRALSQCIGVDRAAIRIYNITTAAAEAVATAPYTLGGANTGAWGIVEAQITLADSATFEIQTQAQTTNVTYGFGTSAGAVGLTMPYEQYSYVEIYKVI